MLKELELELLRIGIVSSESNRNLLKSYDALPFWQKHLNLAHNASNILEKNSEVY